MTIRTSNLRTELSPNDSSDNVHDPSLAPASGVEARDYMNGGLPHEISSPANGNGSAGSPGLKGNITRKQLSGPSSSLAQSDAGTPVAGTSTPPGRRSVQFVRHDTGGDSANHTRQNSFEDDADNTGKKGQSLMSKLKALTAATHARTASTSSFTFGSFGDGSASAPQTPTARTQRRTHDTLEEEGSDIDADAEETADESAFTEATRARRKRRMPRRQESQTAPNTPGYARHDSQRDADSPGGASSRFQSLMRRSTMPEEQERIGMSEGEGRDHLKRQSAWKRGSSFFAGGRGPGGSNSHLNDDEDVPASPRPSNFRRLTGLGGGVSDGEAVQSSRRPRFGASRSATFGAAKWKVAMKSLKLLGSKKDRHEIDYLKSAELMAELRAGAPAALMLASMIMRDEHGNKRIPVLLEQLKIKVTDSVTTDPEKERDSDRHVVFRIELEYGSGVGRMKWIINRSIGDFVKLHYKYKLQTNSDKYLQLKSDVASRPKQPRFPWRAFPYARRFRRKGEVDSDEEAGAAGGQLLSPPMLPPAEDLTAAEATHSEAERPGKKRSRRPSFSNLRRRSTAQGENSNAADAEVLKKKTVERQRKHLETYLQEMVRWLIFRADSNRLCKFLELSALGVRLSAEGGYHGKEGYLAIQTSKGIDFRKVLTPKAVFARHSPKWFLVRSSYIVCVDSPENMHIYDVFLLDSSFSIEDKRRNIKDISASEAAAAVKSKTRHPQHHRLKLQNSERKLKLLARNERMVKQFEDSIRQMMDNSLWSKPNRFGSFAPVRKNVFAQWLVDGRDYMWNVSRAINQATDVIYIHDWWLSPQLYMRRPAAISQKWRLDRLLRKKARQGVKVFVIVYRNVEAAIPIDSEFTKFCLLDLHPNIFVQRSPNQFKKNQFFYAHHEKICIVDHNIAFVGGIDLCFGRWDTPQHSVTDDKMTGFEEGSIEPKDADHCQLWPGKDYSNPRVQDFYQLNEPYAEMYDRSKVPRMPWHDISMQVVGQPARDLTRHFVQRWNYVLRGRKPTRPTPFLLPPSDYLPEDLEAVGLNGTCEVQILRSACNWSLGLEEVEHSIMNAYCKMIEESEHFVYMENQFFITSCETMNTKIVNKIGDAIVERAVRAYKNNEAWRCVIVIPLMPGFQNTVDAADGTSVRLIMQCQFRSISRGEDSIFGRLRAEGIEPEDFISFYSLRAWGKIGPNKALVTEQLYIHAKVIIVDDRIALIGSANINERSMLGSRDSETAAVVRDTDMLWSTMDGKPYLVGRFAHTLRMRLMREHLGLPVDKIMEEERNTELDREEGEFESGMDNMYDEGDDADDLDGYEIDKPRTTNKQNLEADVLMKNENLKSFNHDIDWEQKGNPNLVPDRFGITSDKRVTNNKDHEKEVNGEGKDNWKAAEQTGLVKGRDSVIVDGVREVLITDISPEGKGTLEKPKKNHHRATPYKSHHEDTGRGNDALPPRPSILRQTTEQLGLTQLSQLPALPVVDDTDIGGPPITRDSTGNVLDADHPLMADLKRVNVTKDCMRDPLNDTFFEDTWRTVAETNTKIFRRVFRCNPDNEVQNWHEYQEFQAYAERFSQMQSGNKSTEREGQEHKGPSGPPGSQVVPNGPISHSLANLSEKLHPHSTNEHGQHPHGTVADWAEKAEQEASEKKGGTDSHGGKATVMDEKEALKQEHSNEALSPVLPAGDQPFPTLDDTFTNTSANETSHATEKPVDRRTTFSTPAATHGRPEHGESVPSAYTTPSANFGSQRRRRRATTTRSRKGFSASDDLISKADAEALLSMVQGSLVIFPNDWLKAEEHNSNWLYQVDMVAPLQI